ncbi:MAG TPA: Ger(x)C family spore germination C-terminal domain-containing protein [Feifaniaceae bacterium]|nr:Ger(x)C family spore germination C-terminal domain-containing protein [Feifaniaceae bacterium]
MRRHRRAVRILALLLLVLLVFSGCMGARSPDEYGYALLIGIDKGKTKPYFVSMLLQRGNGDNQSSEGAMAALVGVECSDLFEAVEAIESGLPFSLSLARTTAIVFSQEVARGPLLEQFLSASLGSLHIRYFANLIIAGGRPEDYLKGMQSEINPNIAKIQYNFIEYKEETGMIPAITLTEFYDRAWGKAGDVVLPLGGFEKRDTGGEEEEAKAGEAGDGRSEENAGQKESSAEGQKEDKEKSAQKEDEPEPLLVDALGALDDMPGQTGRLGGLEAGMMGSALFRGTELKGFLNGPHTMLLLLGKGDFKNGRIQLKDKNGDTISILLTRKGTPEVRLSLGEEKKAAFSVSVYASVEQPAAVAGLNKDDVKRDIEAYLETGMQQVFVACQQLGCDSFDLGEAAVRQFTSARQWEAYSFRDVYRDIRAEFDVTAFLEYNPTGSRVE